MGAGVKMAIKALLIDVGGPILDEDHEYTAWDKFLVQLLQKNGIDIDGEELARLVLAATRRCERNPRIAVLWELVRPDVSRFRRLKDVFREFQRRHLAEDYIPRLGPGVKETLASLSKDFLLALAGNQPAWIKGYLEEAGVLGFFRWQLVSEEMGVAKPDTLFFRMILDGLGVSPSEAVMVGDRLDHDVLPARLLGIRTVRVLTGPYAEQVPCSPLHCPDRTIRSLRELSHVLAEV